MTEWSRIRIRNSRGVATVEKLAVVILMACALIACIAIIGPILASKYQWAADLLRLGGAPTVAQKEILTAPASASGTGTIIFLFVLCALSASIFVIPILFPRAHRMRHDVIRSVARRFPVVRAIAAVNLTGEYSIRDLKGMAEENRNTTGSMRAIEPHVPDAKRRPGALEIAASSLADTASSSDATVARAVSDEMFAAPSVPISTASPVSGFVPQLVLDRDLPLIADDDDATRVSIDRLPPAMNALNASHALKSMELGGAISDDAIPFFDLDPDPDEPSEDETRMMIERPSFDQPELTTIDVLDEKTDPLQ